MTAMDEWAVLFDLDGTLVDTAPIWRSAFVALIDARQPVPAGATDGLLGLTALEAITTIHRRLGWSGLDPWRMWRKSRRRFGSVTVTVRRVGTPRGYT